MPEAADSNSTSLPRIQPAYLIDSIYDLSQALHIYKAMLDKLADNPLVREITDLRQRIIVQLGTQADKTSHTPLADQAAADHADLLKQLGRYQFLGVPAFGERKKPDVKSLRDEFIIEKLQQGLSAEQISQALNIRLSVIKRAIANQHNEAEQDTPGKADNGSIPQPR